jgi:hypothetical protein
MCIRKTVSGTRFAAYVDSAVGRGSPVMKATLAFALFLSLFLGAPVYAQSRCSECFKAAQEGLKQCLDNAISEEDKASCDQSQQAQTKVCEKGECKIERDKRDNGNEAHPQTQ